MEDKHFKDWAVEQHEKTNHVYDDKLPYAFHLGLVVDVATKFKHIWTAIRSFDSEFTYQIMYNACWGHDLIEDTRVTYNDIKTKLRSFGYSNTEAKNIVEIIFALTNNKGRNRAERANTDYYAGIMETPGATFIKVCDRIANIKYSELVKSSMFRKYKDEHSGFVNSLGLMSTGSPYVDMVAYMEELLGIE